LHLKVAVPSKTFKPAELLEVLAANAGSLRELRVGEALVYPEANRLPCSAFCSCFWTLRPPCASWKWTSCAAWSRRRA
jgi:hypothetical protein